MLKILLVNKISLTPFIKGGNKGNFNPALKINSKHLRLIIIPLWLLIAAGAIAAGVYESLPVYLQLFSNFPGQKRGGIH